MVAPAFVRQFAAGQEIDPEVADQEIVLHYVLTLLNEGGLVGTAPGEATPGALLFKGGTALRKCVFGSTGRFSQDIDVDASRANGFEDAISDLFTERSPYQDITFSIGSIRYSRDGNFSGTVEYDHPNGTGAFELQISYRMDPILDSIDLELQPQPYFRHIEVGLPNLHGLHPYEMIGEKIMASNRRLGGSGKDVYDLYLWTQRPFDESLVRRLAVLKAWTDQRTQPQYEPTRLLEAIGPGSFRWSDIATLVPRGLSSDPETICDRVRQRFTFLTDVTPQEQELLDDQVSHRHHRNRGHVTDLQLAAGRFQVLDVDQVLVATGGLLHSDQVLVAAEANRVAEELLLYGVSREVLVADVISTARELHYVEASEFGIEVPVATLYKAVEVGFELELIEFLEAKRLCLQLLQCFGQASEIVVGRAGTDVEILRRSNRPVGDDSEAADDDEIDLVLLQLRDQLPRLQRREVPTHGRALPASSVAISLSSAPWARRSEGVRARKSARSSAID